MRGDHDAMNLNERAASCCQDLERYGERLQLQRNALENGTICWDFGVQARGGLEAGLWLARICLADLAQVQLTQDEQAIWDGPSVTVYTDHPVAACMAAQYAGWKIDRAGYFAMGSGPMRAAAAVEPLLQQLGGREDTNQAVGVLETSRLPPVEVADWVAEQCGISPTRLYLLVAKTSSQAGTLQIVARSVETALHKLWDLGFDLQRVVSGFGTAPLPPVAADDLTGIGRTNDAILYGARVTLWVRGDDASLSEVVRARPQLCVERLRRALPDHLCPGRSRLLSDRSASVQPGGHPPDQRGFGSQLSGGSSASGYPADLVRRLRTSMKLGVLASPDSWYFHDLQRAAGSRIQLQSLSFTQLSAGLAERSWVSCAPQTSLDELDMVLVRTMPPGSLEQIVFRMDALHRLASLGTPVYNPPRCLEMAVDKYLASALLHAAGLPTPRTLVCQTVEDALAAFHDLGRDVVVKPLFGSEGRGITRITDEAVAWRVFKSLVQLGAVIYLQQFISHHGWDVRLLLIGTPDPHHAPPESARLAHQYQPGCHRRTVHSQSCPARPGTSGRPGRAGLFRGCRPPARPGRPGLRLGSQRRAGLAGAGPLPAAGRGTDGTGLA